MRNKALIFILLIVYGFLIFLPSMSQIWADEENDNNINYTIYSENGDFLFEREFVVVGDEYLAKDFKLYRVSSLDNKLATGVAKFIEQKEKPKVKISNEPSNISNTKRTICMYSTHNDESYVVGDGVESIYGAGGIHDIAKSLKNEFELMGITCVYDEMLHIPHDSSAYSRSSNTAKSLISTYNPEAIFDIHRDGTSRSYYITNNNNTEKCMVRIVIGKANANYKTNEQFALVLLSVADEICPWLIKDIYYASGHYNQALSGKALLFEMGSHLVEKKLVNNSVASLANVVNTAMFGTTLNTETGELTINGSETETDKLVTDAISGNQLAPTDKTLIIIIVAGLITGSIVIATLINKKLNEKPSKKSSKKYD